MLDDRILKLGDRLKELFTMDISEFTTMVPHVEFHFYHADGEKHVDSVRINNESFVFLGAFR